MAKPDPNVVVTGSRDVRTFLVSNTAVEIYDAVRRRNGQENKIATSTRETSCLERNHFLSSAAVEGRGGRRVA